MQTVVIRHCTQKRLLNIKKVDNIVFSLSRIELDLRYSQCNYAKMLFLRCNPAFGSVFDSSFAVFVINIGDCILDLTLEVTMRVSLTSILFVSGSLISVFSFPPSSAILERMLTKRTELPAGWVRKLLIVSRVLGVLEVFRQISFSALDTVRISITYSFMAIYSKAVVSVNRREDVV